MMCLLIVSTLTKDVEAMLGSVGVPIGFCFGQDLGASKKK